MILLENFRDKVGRIYNPRALLDNLSDKCLYGEFPSSCNSFVDLARVSHSFSNFREEHGNLVADLTILPTPNGLLLETELKNYVPVAKIRATGLVDKEYNVTEAAVLAFDLDLGDEL